MSPIPPRASGGLAGRMGRWSATHRWSAVALWLLFVVVAFVAGQGVGAQQLSTSEQLVGESARAQELLDEAGYETPAGEFVLVRATMGVNRGISFDRTLADVVEAVESTGVVTDVRSPLQRGGEGLRSQDGRTALIQFSLTGPADEAVDTVDPVVEAVEQAAETHPTYEIEQFGSASSAKALNETVGESFERAHNLSIPLTLGILLVTFGALVAAVLPLALALSAFVAALGLMSFTSHLWGVDQSSTIVMLLIGLAVGVDYSLFYLKREREERRRGRDVHTALEIAAATSGRAVLISGVTVMVAMAGMFLTGAGTFIGMAQAAILVVLTAVVGSLTVLPASMALLGDRIDRGRIPFLGRRLQRNADRHRFWTAVLTPVLRRPAIATAVSAGLLLVLAAPALDLRTNEPGADDLPKDNPVVQTYRAFQEAFPGGPAPARVVIRTDEPQAAAVQRAVEELRTRALATGQALEPITAEVQADRGLVLVDVPLVGDGQDEESRDAVRTLREDVVPETVGSVDGVEAAVTGSTAQSLDFSENLTEKAPLVFAFVLVLAFLLLLASFRSVVIAVKAIVLNLLSVGAAYGVLVATFQWGWGEELLGFESTGGITGWIPLFLFVVLFGLSMDYHVFILSRVREFFDRGMSTRDAVAQGITSTAGVVTSAAIIMVAVFATFAALSLVSMKQLGVGLAVAVLLDATVVRAVLLPATMALLGEKNWYLPRWLEWLPHLDHGTSPIDDVPAVDAARRETELEVAGR